MDWKEIKETMLIVGCVVGMLVAFGICLALIVGIPTAAIVWIIEVIKS